MKLTKISNGHYEKRVGDEPTDRYEVQLLDVGYGATWYLTYPGELIAGDACATLSAARELISEHIKG